MRQIVVLARDLNQYLKIRQMNNRFQLRESSVRKSGVFNNVTNVMGRSFISTHLAQESILNGDDLRKSRIQNLPNYRKTNLGETPQFVIVFQTIEIERLSSEIQVLRVKLKEAQRQLFNAQNYEVQIRELTEKCFNYESELCEYREEVQKLNKICETLYHENETLKSRLSEMDVTLKQKYESEKHKNLQLQQEVEKWKTRYQAAEKSKAKELQDLRNLMQCQRKSMIDREIREMTIRFQNQRSGLQNQIRKGRQMLSNKNNEIQDIRQKCQQYEISLMEMKNYQQHIAELESKISVLSQELVRLNEVLRDREDSIQAFKKLQYELNLKLKQQVEWQHECQQLKGLIEARGKEIEEWKIRCSRIEEEAIKAKDLIHFNHELTEKLQVSQKEIQRLNSTLRQKLEEIERWKSKIQEKEMENTKLKNMETEIPQYQNKLNMAKAQNQRINSILKSRLGEIQSWKKRSSELESTIAKFGLIQKEKESMQERFNKQIKNNEELKFAYSKMQSELMAYKKYEGRCREVENTNNGLSREIDRLNHVIKTNSIQINDFRQKFKQLEYNIDQYKNIQTQLKDYQNKIILLTQEIQRLNQLIRNKNHDIDQLEQQKLQLHSKINHYKNYEIKINQNQQIVSKLQNNNQILKRDVENWHNKFRSADARIRQLQNGLFLSNNQKDKLSITMRSKLNELEDFRNKYYLLQNDLRQLSELKQLCQQQHNQIVLYLTDIQSFDRKIKQYEKELAKERNKNGELTNKNGQLIKKTQAIGVDLDKVTKQFEKMSKEFNGNTAKKAKDYDQLHEQFTTLITKSKSTDHQLQTLANKCSQLQAQTRKLMQQFTSLLKQAQKSEQQTRTLYQKLTQYQDYARRIHILDAQLHRLEKQNKNLQDDNKKMRLKYASQIAIEKRDEQFGLLVVLMAAEIQGLRQRIAEREVTFDEMRKSILQPVRKV